MSISESIYGALLDTAAKVKTWLGGDSMQDLEPVHNATYDIAADKLNKLVAGLAEVAQRTRLGNVVCYRFTAVTMPGSDQSIVLVLAGAPAVEGAAALKAGSVVGMAVYVDSDGGGGTLAASWMIADVAQALSVELSDATSHRQAVVTQAPGVELVAAGDLLGVEVQTTGWAAGTATALVVDLFVSYGEEA